MLKSLKALELKTFKQIMIKLLSLQSDLNPQDGKALKGYLDGYRVDHGELRILYTIEE